MCVKLRILVRFLPPDCDIPLCLNTMVRATGLKCRSGSVILIQLMSKWGSPYRGAALPRLVGT